MPSSQPLVSIITPVYNAESFLAKTINSVLMQEYKSWELLLVVDFKSKDSSIDIAKDFASKDPRIKVIHRPENLGVAANRNCGIKEAQGSYIAFLDADDLWMTNKLKLQIENMESTGSAFTFHAYEVIDEAGNPTGQTRSVRNHTVDYNDLLKDNQIGCLTVVIKSSVLKNHSFYQGSHEDFVLWLEILKAGNKALGIDSVLAQYRVVAGSRSNNKIKAALWRWQILRKTEKMSLTKAAYYFVCYFYFALVKRT